MKTLPYWFYEKPAKKLKLQISRQNTEEKICKAIIDYSRSRISHGRDRTIFREKELQVH
jgi:hypothetical protein